RIYCNSAPKFEANHNKNESIRKTDYIKRPMKKYVYSFIVIVFSLSLISCGNKQEQMQQGEQPSETPVVSVKIPTDSALTFSRYSTSIEGIINSEARPKISGYITEVLVDEGQ